MWRTLLFQEMLLKENHYFGRRIWVKTIANSLPKLSQKLSRKVILIPSCIMEIKKR
jgi:hypothetical protein